MSQTHRWHRDQILRRTNEGTEQMRTRRNDLAPKLRAVLFLVDGEHSYGELLERAGALGDLLDSQLRDLASMKLIEVVHPNSTSMTPDSPEDTAPMARHKPKPADLPPVVAAKMQLMLRLESIRANDIDALGAELLEARTLKDLAVSAKSVAAQLKISAGEHESARFWRQAKEILTAWRDLSVREATNE
jgi:hypothetical protein